MLHDENLGYGRAANLALRDGTAELVCVSNADALPERGALATLAAVAQGEPRVGMVGPVFGDKTDRYHSRLPTGVTMLGRIFAGTFSRGPIPPPDARRGEGRGPAVGGLLRDAPETWELMGGFDDGFFLWYEDVDLAKRLHDQGYRNLVTGSARVGHSGASSFVQIDRPLLRAMRLDSVERYIDKHHPRLSTFTPLLLGLSKRLRATAPMTRELAPGRTEADVNRLRAAFRGRSGAVLSVSLIVWALALFDLTLLPRVSSRYLGTLPAKRLANVTVRPCGRY